MCLKTMCNFRTSKLLLNCAVPEEGGPPGPPRPAGSPGMALAPGDAPGRLDQALSRGRRAGGRRFPKMVIGGGRGRWGRRMGILAPLPVGKRNDRVEGAG